MIDNFNDLPSDGAIDGDICIIGAGAAGLLLAREFSTTKTRVVVIESGGWRADELSEELCDGEIQNGSFRGLQAGRARTFGGATTLWGGQCIPLDPIDLEVRPWVPFSGWPISWQELKTYYERAQQRLDIGADQYEEAIWRQFDVAAVGFDDAKLRSVHSVFMRNPNFGKRFRREIAASENIRVLLLANAVQLETNAAGDRLQSVRVRSAGGKEGSVRAKLFVLCAGGIENARLMLLSDETNPQGIGNSHDLVGRFFQDHPCGLCATIETESPRVLQDRYNLFYGRTANYLPKIALSEKIQREQEVLNCVGRLVYEYEPLSGWQAARDVLLAARARQLPDKMLQKIFAVGRSSPDLVESAWRYVVKGYSPAPHPRRIFLEAFSEQAPDVTSRVGLSDKRDRLSLRKVKMDWRLHELSVRTLQVYAAAVRSEFERLGLGNVKIEPWTDSVESCRAEMMDSYHHAGTTRMAENATTGVVDSNCQVFGVDGLFVAGSSVFPTSGAANPTLTIAALALRLADHLKLELARQDAPSSVGDLASAEIHGFAEDAVSQFSLPRVSAPMVEGTHDVRNP